MVAWLDEASFVGGDHSLDTVTAAELHQDVPDVGLDGGFAEEKPPGDLAVRQAAGYLDEDLRLPRGEVGQGRPRAVRWAAREVAPVGAGCAASIAAQPAGDRSAIPTRGSLCLDPSCVSPPP